jgi:hypothetical protein
MSLNVGFVSTRFSGIDGVSLEAAKWAEVIEGFGHYCYWFAGESNRRDEITFIEKRAHFKRGLNEHINGSVYQEDKYFRDVDKVIAKEKNELKQALSLFLGQYKIDFLIIENALSIPMQIPLGLALSELLSTSGIQAIAHNHDFFWERDRFHLNGHKEMIEKTFPPRLPNVDHVVINSVAQRELYKRTGIKSHIIPNVMNYSMPPEIDPGRSSQLRKVIGLQDDDIMVLQPTRLVARKGIGATLEIISRLDNYHCKLVVSHSVDDEGWDYYRWVSAKCDELNIDIRFINDIVADPIINNFDPRHKFSLWEVYDAADIIAYPSLCEGFGNALLEAIYLKKPVVLNRYEIFVADIEPKGFDFIKFDQKVTSDTVAQIKTILADRNRKTEMVEKNFRLANKYYSYDLLSEQLSGLMAPALAA